MVLLLIFLTGILYKGCPTNGFSNGTYIIYKCFKNELKQFVRTSGSVWLKCGTTCFVFLAFSLIHHKQLSAGAKLKVPKKYFWSIFWFNQNRFLSNVYEQICFARIIWPKFITFLLPSMASLESQILWLHQGSFCPLCSDNRGQLMIRDLI